MRLTRITRLTLLLVPGVLLGALIQPTAQAASVPLTSPGVAASSVAAAPTAAAAPALAFTRRGTGFGQTVLITNSGDGTRRFFTVDRIGRVLAWVPGTSHASLYLDLRAKVRSVGGEQGLLGLTFYPDFKRVPLVFVSYTGADGALKVSRFLLPSYTAASVNPATETLVMSIPHPTYSNHNAGMILFGKDGYFFVSTGDGGGAGDPFAHAQTAKSLSGKILRVDASNWCGGRPYCIPATNPFAHSPGYYGEVWEFGLRNPWRFSSDPVTGTLWIGDVGQDGYEEIDTAALGVSNLNFGWSCREANVVYNSSRCNALAHYIAPRAVIPHPSGEAIIGGVVYRGTRFPSFAAQYLFGDYVTGTVWTMPSAGGAVAVSGRLAGVTSFGTTQAGEIWATTLSGELYELTTA